jgi:hypothetical protein
MSATVTPGAQSSSAVMCGFAAAAIKPMVPPPLHLISYPRLWTHVLFVTTHAPVVPRHRFAPPRKKNDFIPDPGTFIPTRTKVLKRLSELSL